MISSAISFSVSIFSWKSFIDFLTSISTFPPSLNQILCYVVSKFDKGLDMGLDLHRNSINNPAEKLFNTKGRHDVMNPKLVVLTLTLITVLMSCCTNQSTEYEPEKTREDSIPAHAVKVTPSADLFPPILHSDEWEEPVPMEAINTAGAEDSPFVYENDFYFFFTPDPSIPAENQVTDGVTGIYVSHNINGVWTTPERVALQEPGKLALDGCAFVGGEKMWFCSAREGYAGVNWFTAEFQNGTWTDWKEADFDPDYEVGELHITADGSELYFHSYRSGGKGGLDIWVSKNQDGTWQEPVNVGAVNTTENEGWPYITPGGTELWLNRWYKGSPAVFRSTKVNGAWQEPELIVSQFAGEPTLDREMNLYFVHHFYEDGTMIEADIYVAYHKNETASASLSISSLVLFIIALNVALPKYLSALKGIYCGLGEPL